MRGDERLQHILGVIASLGHLDELAVAFKVDRHSDEPRPKVLARSSRRVAPA